jgi:hypothetical protein
VSTHRHESGDLLSVLDELYADTLADGRVRLLRFYTDFLQNDALRVRGTTGWRGFVDVTECALFVTLVRLDGFADA